jgi:hypothetical protein
MPSRVDKARAAFTKVYDDNLWGLDQQPPQLELMQHIADVIEDNIRKYKIASVTEFGCGFWNYAKLVDWNGLTYNGYDVSLHPVRFNADAYGAANIRFHHLVDGVKLAPADLLICKDVLQHLPTDDVQHYLAMFKDSFSYLLILNASFPDDNLNGQIDYGGYRALRLDLPPFNETVEVIDEWDNPLFGVTYHEQVCLLRGNRGQPASVKTWAKRLVRRIRDRGA